MIVPMSEAAANLVERGRVRRFTAGGCRARLTLRAGFDTGELTLPYELLSEKTMLHLSKVDLAALELDKKARPAQIAADVHLERRPENSEPLLLMGTIDEARFFSMWQMVVVIAGRRLVLSWGRGARALLPCPPTISKLVNIFAKHLGRAPLAAVPRPDFVKADDLKLCPNPSAAVLDWKRPRREQVEMAMQGSLSRAVGEPLEGEKSNRLALIDGGSNGQVYLPPHETLKPHELRACFCATPDAVKWAYMPRNEPGMPKKWNDWVGTMPKVLRGLMSDVREVRGLEEAADPWARQPPSKWPKWYTAERCAAGTYPAVGKPRPFGIGLTPSTKLGRQLSEEDPAYFYVDLDHWEASWLDPERGTKIPIDIERKNKDKEGNAVDGPALRVMKLVKEHLPRTDEAGPSKRQRGGSEDEEDGAKKKGKKKARGSEDDDDEWKP